jgi:hypothetical protein
MLAVKFADTPSEVIDLVDLEALEKLLRLIAEEGRRP